MGIGSRFNDLHPLKIHGVLGQLFDKRLAHRMMAVPLAVENAADLRLIGIQRMGEEGLRHALRMRGGIAVRLKNRLGERGGGRFMIARQAAAPIRSFLAPHRNYK